MAFYQVEVSEQARKEIRQLPGNMRQRILRTLRTLEQDPRPLNSLALDIDNDSGLPIIDQELRRIRIEAWRIVYVIEDEVQLLTVLTVRKRPPYQYEDLEILTRKG